MRGLAIGVVLMWAAAGCLNSQLTPCGDQFCPPGKACHAASGSCYGADQLAACDGVLDGSECRIADLVGYCRDGICLAPRCGDGIPQDSIGEQCDEGELNSDAPDAVCRTDCLPARCGDGIIDGGEVCDDGNALPGDACAPGCGSNETCGNGVIDAGEECDDANTLARDGCSGCLREVLVSQPIRTTGARPRQFAVMVHDAARQRTVLFGGRAPTSGLRADTWEWDGVRWRELKPIQPPSPRVSAAGTYDSARKRVVMFGGDDGMLRDDLWEFDGARWVEQLSLTRPPGRKGHAVAYDAGRKRLVVFGGLGANGRLGDTWEWDGTSWFDVSSQSTTPPPAMDDVSMAYDPGRGEIVLFGGKTTDTTYSQRMWRYAAAKWQEIDLSAVTTKPVARAAHYTTFDAVRGRILVVGGRGPGSLRDVWEWSGTAWTLTQSLAFFPNYSALAYDVARRQLVLTNSTSTWTRNVTGNFAVVVAPPSPEPRMQASATYDQRRGRTVVYGGEGPSGAPPDNTWEWDGARWTQLATAGGTNPGPRRNNPMAYSPLHGAVLAGGLPDYSIDGDTWAWNGATWQQIEADEPMMQSRVSHGMVWDGARSRFVVYGGNSGSVDTLEWDGTGWTQALTTSPFSYRHNFAMGYDPIRNRTLLAGGGYWTGNFFAYEYDGTSWSQIISPPVYGKGSSMVYDPNRRALVWFVDPEDIGAEIWEWNGAWTQRKPEPSIGPTYRAATVYDRVRGELVVFGGRSNGTIVNTTTVIGYQPNAAVEACTQADLDYDRDQLPGCADPDCAGRCTPLCVGAMCPAGAPRCGDGTCDPLEDCLLCPGDCATGCPVAACGDFRCTGGEDAMVCPGDCL